MHSHAPFEPTAGARAVWQARRQLGRTVCAVVRDPFDVFIERGMFEPVAEGVTLAELAPAEPGAWLCQVDDEFIGRAHWHHLPPPGAIVVFRQLPQGGGGKGSLRVLLQIALMVVLNGVIPGVGYLLPGEIAVGAIAGNLLINALIPLDRSNSSGADGAQQYNAQAQGNVARIGQPIPEIFGYDHGWPDLASQPYALYENNEQFLYVALVVGRGQYLIDKVSIGDTSITSFSDATLVRVGPAQGTLAGPGQGFATLADQTLVSTLVTVSQDVSSVEMKTLDYAGPFAVCGPERTVTSIGIDIILPRGLDAGRSISWQVGVRLIDDFDAALGAWTVLASQTYSTANPIPVRLSYDYAVTARRYQVRLLRTDTRATEDASAHDISWLALRGTLSVAQSVDADDCTYVCVRIKATGQLSGSLRFRVMSNRMLPTWTGSAWTAATATRNPAWALARVLAARGVADAQIDLDQLLALATTWAARQDNFDHRFDAVSTTWDALALIARVGRAVPLIRGAKYTFARDEQQTLPVAAYGMRNIRKGSFALALALPTTDPMTTLDLEYWDHRRWDWVTVTAQVYDGVVYGYRGDANRPVGVPEPDELARGRIKMPGIIGENHAIRTVVYTLADGFYRRMVATYSTEMDGLLPAPLSLTVLQHDVGNFGQGGDVADWDVGTLTIGTTEPLQWEPLATHYVRLQKPTGELEPAIAVTPGATDHDMVLASAPGFTPLFDDASRERTRYYFGPAANMGALCKVRGIVPRSEREIEHRVVLEDDRVHSADNAWLPGGGVQDPVSTGSPVGEEGGASIVNLEAVNRNTPILGNVFTDFSLQVLNDGRFAEGDSAGAVSAYLPTQWLNPQTVTSATAGLYEVYFSVVSSVGVDTIGGAALDTWLPLDTSRMVTFYNGAPALVAEISVDVSIRDVATLTVQDSANYYYYTHNNSP